MYLLACCLPQPSTAPPAPHAACTHSNLVLACILRPAKLTVYIRPMRINLHSHSVKLTVCTYSEIDSMNEQRDCHYAHTDNRPAQLCPTGADKKHIRSMLKQCTECPQTGQAAHLTSLALHNLTPAASQHAPLTAHLCRHKDARCHAWLGTWDPCLARCHAVSTG